MWWNDIKEIKDWMETIAAKLVAIQMDDNCFSDRIDDIMMGIANIGNELPKFHQLINPEETLTLYAKHIDKISEMMLEFKGIVSMARASMAERKEQQREFEELKDLSKIAKEIYNSMQQFIKTGNELEDKKFFKLDAIYRKVCEIEDENPKKKGKSRKKSSSN